MKECEGIELNMGNMNHFQCNSQNSQDEHSANENTIGCHDQPASDLCQQPKFLKIESESTQLSEIV